MCISVPIASIWYSFLAKLVKAEGWNGILIKLLIDQTIYAAVTSFLYLFVLKFMSTLSLKESFDDTKLKHRTML